MAQNFRTIAPYTIEEAYEVADAIERNVPEDLRDELGDLLLQVVYHAQMAEELGAFDFGDVVYAITAKLLRRHPHVFVEGAAQRSPAEVAVLWEQIKGEEKAERAARGEARGGTLGGVPAALPALARALKLQQQAARVGFDWAEIQAVMAKIREEIEEMEAALATGTPEQRAEELGDLLFAVVNLGRHLGQDPEAALRGTNRKFERRFAVIEARLQERGKRPEQVPLSELEALWQAAKRDEER